MNHDETNNPNIQPLIDPELEARVVAWVAGEASAFEAAELTRLIGEKPELGIFKRRIEAVHGLAGEAVRPDKEPLRLSAERRTKLLQSLGANENKSTSVAPAPSVIASFEATKKRHRKDRQWLLALAACLTVGLFTFLSIPFSKHPMRPEPTATAMGPGAAADKNEYLLLEMPTIEAPKQEEGRSKKLKSDLQFREAALGAAIEYAAKTKQARESHTDGESRAQGRSGGTGASGRTTFSAPVSESIVGDGSLAASVRASQRAKWDSSSPIIGASAAGGQTASKVGAAVLNESFRGATGAVTSAAYYGSTGGRQDADKQAKKSQIGDAVAFGIGSPSPASAPVGAEDEKLELSPFNVTSPTDRGYYVSADTRAGSRQRTELKDVGSAITVVSSEFLRDIGASNASEVSQYAAKGADLGKESPVRGNFMASDSTTPTVAQGYINPEAVALRGETDQLRTRSPFKVEPSFDGYNRALDRVGEKKSDKNVLDDDRPLPPPLQKSLPPVTPTEVNAAKEPVSTFSLHVSDVSFRLAQAALANNEEMDRASIRPEEFYNAFSYGDPTPTLAEKVSCRVEQSAHPFLQQRNLVRIATKVAASGRDAAQPLHLTVLLDTSGSMEREDRTAVVHRAMETLVSLLGPNDRLTLIGFARQPRLLAESLPGDQAHQVLDIIARTPAEGGTNLEEALKLAGELARRQFETAAQNRIVLLTDGAANLGNADPALLATSIEALRQQGIAFDACGVGLEGLDDTMLEALTRKGDGRYYVLNSPEAADAGFAKQLAGAFRPAAENVKLQVRFNPARVGNYRLIGFEQHRLREEDFRNDRVDAAELAAEEAAVAIYQVEALPQGEGELGEVYIRFRDAATGNMVERSWTLSYDPQAPAFDRATPSMQLAGTAALLAEKLRGGETGDVIKLSELAPIVSKLRSHYANEPRVQELVTMFDQMRRLSGE